MSKKLFIVITVILILSLDVFGNSITNADKDKLDISNLMHNQLSFSNDAVDLDKLEKIDNNLKISHAVFAGITYASLLALDAIGIPLLYYAFTNPDYQYYTQLKYAHIAIAASALLTFATTVILAFTKIGIKIKNGLEVRKTHFTAAIVTLSFYVLELSSIILSAVFFANKYDGAKWVGLAHGITSGVTTLAFSVSFITVFF